MMSRLHRVARFLVERAGLRDDIGLVHLFGIELLHRHGKRSSDEVAPSGVGVLSSGPGKATVHLRVFHSTRP